MEEEEEKTNVQKEEMMGEEGRGEEGEDRDRMRKRGG